MKSKLRLLKEHPVFFTLMGLSCIAAVYSFLVVPWPPFGDFAGHVEIMDVFARGDDPDTAYPDTYYVARRFAPNTLSAHLAALLHPLLNAHQTGRLLLACYAIAFPLSALALARAFGRSPWLALAAVPLSYHGLLVMGALNFLLGLPFLFFSVALARTWIERGGLKLGFALAAALSLGYFAHLITFCIAAGICTALLILHVRERRHWARLLSMAPTLPLLLVWVLGVSSGMKGQQGGLGLFYETGDVMLSRFHLWAMSIFRDTNLDDYAFLVLVGIWLTAMLFRDPARENQKEKSGETTSPTQRALEALRRHDLEAITICCLVAWPILPAHMAQVDVIGQRVIIIFLIFLSLWPRFPDLWNPPLLVAVPLVAIALSYPVFAAGKFVQFQEEVLGELPEAIESLPDKTFLGYSFHDPENPITTMGGTWHIPKGIHAIANGGITDDSFAWRPTTAVQYLPGQTPERPGWEFWRGQNLVRMDYVLFRGLRRPSARDLEDRTSLIFHDREWWLYEVRPYEEWEEVTMHAGPGALNVSSGCPADDPLVGFTVESAGGALFQVAPVCIREGKIWRNPGGVGRREELSEVENVEVICNTDEVLIGLHGRAASGVNQLGAICGDAASREPESLEYLEVTGQPGGEEFQLLCPENYSVVRLMGNVHSPLSGIGVLCQEPDG